MRAREVAGASAALNHPASLFAASKNVKSSHGEQYSQSDKTNAIQGRHTDGNFFTDGFPPPILTSGLKAVLLCKSERADGSNG